MAPFKLILFDLDDTLCDYVGARTQRLRIAFGNAFEEGGTAPVDLDAVIAESIKMHPHGADHFGELLSRFGLQDEEAAGRARHWYQTNRFHGLKLFPDALELLHLAKSAWPGCKIGLITNGPAEVQRAKIELLELEAHVDFVLISGEFGCAKPDPAIFREAMRLGGATPEETLVIGDSPEFDIAGAKGLRISAVWVNRTGGTWSFGTPCPDFEVDSLTAVGSLIAELLELSKR